MSNRKIPTLHVAALEAALAAVGINDPGCSPDGYVTFMRLNADGTTHRFGRCQIYSPRIIAQAVVDAELILEIIDGQPARIDDEVFEHLPIGSVEKGQVLYQKLRDLGRKHDFSDAVEDCKRRYRRMIGADNK